MASEIRVDKINSLSGVGTVTLSPTGVDIAGITTAATLRATTGIVTSLTAGSLTSLGAVSGTTGTFSAAVSGTTGTFSGDITAVNSTVTADLSIADKIVHTGDANTNIRFPAADTITAETGGSERARIDSNGNILLGLSSALSSNNARLQVAHTNGNADIIVHRAGDNANPPSINFQKTRNASIGNYGTIVQDDDELGSIRWGGADGSNIGFAARIVGAVDGAPGANDMPGRIQFHTSADGGEDMAERVRITSEGKMGVGTNDPNRTLSVKSNGGQFSIIDDDDSKGQFYCNAGTVSIWATGGSSIAGSLDFATTPSGGSTASRLQISSAGDVTVNSGNLVIGTSGKGIDFSATGDGSGSMVNELLSDYEIGTFTPVVNLGVTGATYDIQRGGYILIGKLLHFQYSIRVNGGTPNSSHLRFGGLPYNSFNGTAYTTAGANIGYQEGDFTDQQVFHIPQNAADIRVYNKTGSLSSGNSHTLINKYINFYGSYIINH